MRLFKKAPALTSALPPGTPVTHPEYLQKVKEIEEIRQQRLFVIKAFRDYEMQCVDGDFERDKAAALQEFEVRVHCMCRVTLTYT